MLIDFHTHLFPDAVAPRAVDVLVAGTVREEGRALPPRGEATEAGILHAMKRDCVPLSVVLPIVTKPSQSEHILAFAESLNRRYADRLIACKKAFEALAFSEKVSDGKPSAEESVLSVIASPESCLPSEEERAFCDALGGGTLLSFASVHPDDAGAEDQLKRIAEQGFRGIKLHPEFQHFELDSPRAVRLISTAESLGLITVVHAGRDIGMPPPPHGAPEAISHLLEYIEGERLVAAHLGGFRMWDDVEKYLVGKPLFLDTSYLGLFDGEPTSAQFCRIIRAHGSKKILYGSDYPWKSAREVSARVKTLALREDELADIFYLNAANLLFS